MTKKKLIIVVVVALVAAGGAYKTVLAKPAKKAAQAEGARRGLRAPEGVPREPRRRPLRQAVRSPWSSSTCRSPRAATARPTPPEGYGTEPQEAVVRDIITNELTDVPDRELIGHEGREKIKKRILESIKKHTDVHVEEVLFPDVTVQ